ncbi:MAG: helix-turn-helix transcriptional regulator [Anaerolineaceae bacterium]|nr:helix-turn-helix transcriptional regulator [Anaerolineaceae bacterium]MBN2677779.1 helix-turn-helix transcriptional regulator [Anaerolineaceae bacterium]
MNISDSRSPKLLLLADLFQLIGQPIRIQILLAIGECEACVCHLEAVTGMRQAVISQHLMLLRKAGLVSPNRAGRNIYYRLENPALLELIKTAAMSLGLDPAEIEGMLHGKAPGCPCPRCQASPDCSKPGEVTHA